MTSKTHASKSQAVKSAKSAKAAAKSSMHDTSNVVHQDSIEQAKHSAFKPVHDKAAAATVEHADSAAAAKIPAQVATATDTAAAAETASTAVSATEAASADAASTAAAGAEGSALAAGVSPLAIGAGVLGVVAVAAAATGGSNSSEPIGQNNTNALGGSRNPQTGHNQSGGNKKPGSHAHQDGDKTPDNQPQQEGNKTPGNHAHQDGNKTPGNHAQQQDGNKTPDNDHAQQDGNKTPDNHAQQNDNHDLLKPIVAPSGETALSPDSFKLSTPDGKAVEYIKITGLAAAEGEIPSDNIYGQRFIRIGDDDGKTNANGNAEKAVAGQHAAPAAQAVQTAYEVIEVKTGITRADAEAQAKAMGGKLLVIDDQKELNWLNKNLFGKLGAYDGPQGDAATKTDQLAKNGAWTGENKFPQDSHTDAIIRNGNGKDATPAAHFYKHEGNDDKLTHFVVEYNNYKSPLTIGTGADAKPVNVGDFLTKDEFSKLSWNASQNAHGVIQFQAAHLVGDQLQVIENGPKQQLTISESGTAAPSATNPTPPSGTVHQDAPGAETKPGAGSPKPDNTQESSKDVTLDGMKQHVGHDQSHGIDAKVFSGDKAGAPAPAFVKIEAILDRDGQPLKADAGGLKLGTGDHATAVQPNKVLSADDFAKLSWDGKGNEGGSFKFVAVSDAQGTAINGATHYIVPVVEQTPPPAYPDGHAHAVQAAHDAAHKLDASILTGDKSNTNGQAPAQIRITEIKETNGTDAQHSALRLDGGAELSTADGHNTVSMADFGKLVWDTTHNDGGSFKFQALDADGVPILGSDEQTVTITEAAAPAAPAKPVSPPYEANKAINVGHDVADAKVDKSVFEGTDAAHKPEAVKVTGVGSGALQVDGHAVTEGQVITADHFDKVTWDASKGEGGSFKFTPVHADGTTLEGAAEQSITVNEAAAPANPPAAMPPAEAKIGDYPDSHEPVQVTHDEAGHPLDKSIFIGRDEAKAPDAVKILHVHGIDGYDTNARTLSYGTGGSDEHNLDAGSLLAKGNFDKVHWDASLEHLNGNYSFQFQAVTADGHDIPGAKPQTIIVHEAAENPVYPASLSAHIDTHDGNILLPDTLFKGTDAAKEPVYIQITEISPTNGDGQRALYLTGDHAQDIKIVQGDDSKSMLSYQDYAQLHWDGAHNEGGSFKFIALGGDKQPIPGHTPQTVTVTEAAAPAQQAAHDQGAGTPPSANGAQSGVTGAPAMEQQSFHAADSSHVIKTLVDDQLMHTNLI